MNNSKVKEVSDGVFENEVMKNELPVLVDFWAPWCGPCRMMAPVLDEVANEFDGRLAVKKVNVDHNQAVAGRLGIHGIPALFLFHKGKAVKGWVGVQPKASLVSDLSALV